MANIQVKRGEKADANSLVFKDGEPVWVTDEEEIRVGDNITPGGIPVKSKSINIKVSPSGTIQSTNVQGAIEELDGRIDNFGIREDLTNQIDGISRTFIVQNDFVLGSTQIYYCGIELRSGEDNDYIEISPRTILFSSEADAPEDGDVILISYEKVEA